MDERELLLKVLKGESTPKKPWFADLMYLYNALQYKGELEPKYMGDEGYLQFHRDLGVGVCFYPPYLWKLEFTGGVKYHSSVSDGIHTTVYHTPKGSLTAQERFLPEAYTTAYVEHFVKTIGDLDIMTYIFENTRYTENYEAFEKIDRLWGEVGIAAGLAPISVSPLQSLLTRWAGVDKTVEIYMEDTEAFEEYIQRIQDSQDTAFEIIAGSNTEYIEFAENLSSEITGKTFFEKYNMPYYKKRISQLHASGKYVGIHIDGTLRSCLPLLEKCGFDAAEAVTPGPIGDLSVEELRAAAGDNIVLWGGIPGALFSDKYSEEVFVDHVTKVLKTFKQDKRFVLGVADQVPPDGLISRVKKVRELVEAI